MPWYPLLHYRVIGGSAGHPLYLRRLRAEQTLAAFSLALIFAGALAID